MNLNRRVFPETLKREAVGRVASSGLRPVHWSGRRACDEVPL